MKGQVAGTVMFAALATLPGAAGAGPLSRLGKSSTDEALVSKVATFVCIRDDRGWHYMRGERRVTCRPVRPKGAFWNWHCEGPRCGWWHPKERRWGDSG